MALACLAVALAAATPAHAEVPIDLRWQAPHGCPQESDVRSRIQKIVGSGRLDSPLRADGTITRVDRRFRLELELRIRDLVGTRALEASSCDDLAGAAAVEIGLLLNSAAESASRGGASPAPETGAGAGSRAGAGAGARAGAAADAPAGSSAGARTGAGTDDPEGASADAPPAAVVDPEVSSGARATEVAPEPPTPPPSAPRRPWGLLVQAPLLALGVGPLPARSTGVGLSVGLERAHWEVQLSAVAWWRQTVSAADFPGYTADVDRLAASLAVCREFRIAWFGYAPCLVTDVQRVSASASGRNVVSIPRHAFAVAAGAGIKARLHLASWLRLVAAMAGTVEVVRPELTIDGLGLVSRFAPAALIGTLGLEWAL